MKNSDEKGRPNLFKRFLLKLGPGLVTGAADDDPSGIVTYSMAGAQLGTSLLWMAWLTWPMMAAVQLMCARIGMVTGAGLGSALSKKFSKAILSLFCISLFAANAVNIGADLSGMGDSMTLLTGLNYHVFVLFFGFAIIYSIIKFKYSRIESVLKWLALALFAYVITAFIIRPDWSQVARDSFSLPDISNKKILEMVVAILGTTISPYLFFWQSAQEVEEEKSQGKNTDKARKNATEIEIKDRRTDVLTGTLLSNLVMFFIILTTALTLHKHGIVNISSSKEVALALRPLAGNFATLLYTVGIVAVGFLAIPTLAGSAAYAFCEVFRKPLGLNKKFPQATAFYIVIGISVLIGIVLNFFGIKPVDALYWSAVVNGLLAPFLLTAILLVARDGKIMEGQPSPWYNFIMVGITTLLMFAAGVGMFVL